MTFTLVGTTTHHWLVTEPIKCFRKTREAMQEGHQYTTKYIFLKRSPRLHWWRVTDELGFEASEQHGCSCSSEPSKTQSCEEHWIVLCNTGWMLLASSKCLCHGGEGSYPLGFSLRRRGSGNCPYWVITTLCRESYMVRSIWKWKAAVRKGSTSSMLARMMLRGDLVVPHPKWAGTDGLGSSCNALRMRSEVVSLNKTQRQINIVKTTHKAICEIKTTAAKNLPSLSLWKCMPLLQKNRRIKRTLLRPKRKADLFMPPPWRGENNTQLAACLV